MMIKGNEMTKGYEEYMQKVHSALILERENDIIVELRATREYLDAKIDESIAESNERFDNIEKRMDGMESKMDNIEKRMDGMESKMDVIIELLKK
ncbi:MAG: hypothetical protein U9N49_03550 [Campylobacterota bacterium]|nr:hypothetical protein [Campylobacterota bacterium]